MFCEVMRSRMCVSWRSRFLVRPFVLRVPMVRDLRAWRLARRACLRVVLVGVSLVVGFVWFVEGFVWGVSGGV
jgi:hypothetical protein